MREEAESIGGLVLVADDDATQRLLSRQYLEFAGFEVCEASDGERALEVFAERQPGMVLMDVRMPKANGFEACETIRSRRDGTEVPIIMVTGLEDLESIERAYDAGATDFITKPVVWETLGHRAKYLMRAGNAIRALRVSESRLAQAQRVARLGSWEWDFRRRTMECSPDVYELFSIRPESVGGSFPELMKFIHPEDQSLVQEVVEEALVSGESMLVEFRFVDDHGSEVVVEMQAKVLAGENGKLERMVGSIQDVSDRKQAERKIHELAFYDSLTQLPNRELFHKRTERAIRAASRDGHKLALLFLDLDGFKYVNDSMGHIAGDKLLCTIADCLQQSLRASDLVAKVDAKEHYHASVSRLGGDEFSILLSDLTNVGTAAVVAERVLEQLSQPSIINGKELAITGSLGIAIYPDNAENVDELLKNADIAMYHAKQQGRNSFLSYNPGMDASVQLRLSMEAKLKQALEKNQFSLYYQAKIDIRTGGVPGVEALLRWDDDELGRVSPAQFMPVAEDTGLIVPIGEWVLNEACRQFAEWRDAGLGAITVAVNLSSLQFKRGGLLAMVERVVRETGMDSTYLELELTESVIMENAEETIRILNELKNMGITLSVDDFGTGYSSMAYLRRFPLDVVKIDRSFVSDISFNDSDTVIVRAMIALAQGLNLTCIAEGVETEEQLQVLQTYGCDQVQGFFLNRPMPASAMTEFLRIKQLEPFAFAAAACSPIA
ncbi:MAG: putative bifunctional diguanylate cyclase/phosphodiesterase [Congregibacter sp.]